MFPHWPAQIQSGNRRLSGCRFYHIEGGRRSAARTGLMAGEDSGKGYSQIAVPSVL